MLLFFIILLEGFVTISVEILAIRQLLPFVGNNIIVTSLIIGVFLLFLAIGYRRGGSYRENYHQILQKNFIKAGLWIGIGLSYAFINIFFLFSAKYFTQNSLITLTFYLLLVIAPAVYILGQTVPITINLFKREKHLGSISGKVLYLSTLGSFLGAVLTSLLLFNYLGVAWTVFFNFSLLLTLVFLLSKSYKKELVRLSLMASFTVIIYIVNVQFEHNLFLKTNNYANYLVAPQKNGKWLMVNNAFSSFISNENKATEYIELIKKIIFKDLRLTNKNILVLGGGGFTLSAESTYGNHITYVDIDKDINKIVMGNFLEKINGKFVAADARLYVKKSPQKYDVIISDAYKNLLVIPSYLLTREHLLNIRNALTDSGFAVFNLIARPFLDDKYSKRADNTINTIFPNCMKIPVNYQDDLANIIYVCKKTPLEFEQAVYTDNLNTATLDYFYR